jgi:hypothetical protein
MPDKETFKRLMTLNLAREAEGAKGREVDSRLRGNDGAPSRAD